MNKKDRFELLYQEYKDLKDKVKIEAQINIPGTPYKPKHVNPEDLKRWKELVKILVKDYKDCFEGKISEWYEIQSDL